MSRKRSLSTNSATRSVAVRVQRAKGKEQRTTAEGNVLTSVASLLCFVFCPLHCALCSLPFALCPLQSFAPRRPDDRRGAFHPIQALRAAPRKNGRTVTCMKRWSFNASGHSHQSKVQKAIPFRKTFLDHIPEQRRSLPRKFRGRKLTSTTCYQWKQLRWATRHS